MGNLKTTSVVVALVVTIAALAASSVAFAAPSRSRADTVSRASAQASVPSHQDISLDRNRGDGTSGGLSLTALDLTLMLGGGFVLVASGVALSGLVLRRVRV